MSISTFQDTNSSTSLVSSNTLVNQKLADHLSQIASYYSLTRDKYRHETYAKASSLIKDYPFPITSGSQASQIIPRIGPSLRIDIDQFLTRGSSQRLTELDELYGQRNTIAKLFENVYGIGPATANTYYDLGFRTLQDLWYEVPSSLAPQLGVTLQTYKIYAQQIGLIQNQEQVLDPSTETHIFYEVLRNMARSKGLSFPALTSSQRLGIQYYTDFKYRIPRSEMVQIEQKLKGIVPNTIEWLIAGSYRRGEQDSGDIDILVKSFTGNTASDIQTFVNTLKQHNLIVGDLAMGTAKYMGIYKDSSISSLARRIDILVVEPYVWSFATLYFTGSDTFNVLLRKRSLDLGLSLNEKALTNSMGMSYPAQTEQDIFTMLGVVYLTPEQRLRSLHSLTLLS